MASSSTKEPFFRKGGEGLANKYEPSSRYTYDRERGKSNNANTEDNPDKMLRRSGEHHMVEEGLVGFSNLPKQIYRKSVNKKFEFTLMVVGASGLGKSTLINSLFLSDLYGDEYPGPSKRIRKTLGVEATCVVLRENGVTLQLTVVDTPGFGDAVDNTNCWQPIIEYIDGKYEEYLNDEFRFRVEVNGDHRVHTCLYFIAPTGHSLSELDIEFMKNLHEKVNIIPLIGKADTMTVEECAAFKTAILQDIKENNIKIFELPDRADEKENMIQQKLRDRIPFAVVGSNTVLVTPGKPKRGRQYPWGTVEIENLEHSDFLALRCMLIRTHMQNLKDVTHEVHYENYRQQKLAALSPDGTEITSISKNSLIEMSKAHDNTGELKKIELEMREVFLMKMKEKTENMQKSEEILQKRAEMIKLSLEKEHKDLKERKKQFEKEKKLLRRAEMMRLSLEKEHKDLKERRKQFEKEKKAWEAENGDGCGCMKEKHAKTHS